VTSGMRHSSHAHRLKDTEKDESGN